MKRGKYEILIYRDEDGMYIAECVNLPGCISDGKTKREAAANIKEAITAYLESTKKHREQLPVVEAPVLTRVFV